ncbi:ribosome biogenesis protein BRX1 homolog 1 [Physcomitrium patens]|uniref:Brix domain-containing protein n=1 Tax=Physcomitrium patens TaxID=3218 RepID=A9SR48_PHYPA|nr:ribosome biogenesis protein BRX1 homolog 1-like [Physcomitrium patens]PNR37664.1 hypothetical protein PHYPA_020773 [Physcomitrium patens]|eukprot:XP_024398120.1 ribosome biogenesis protein BRX1 homolog 1-like [Physcomitrella patens]
MGKKRKSQQVAPVPAAAPVVEAEPPRKRTLLGLKPQPEAKEEVKVNGSNGTEPSLEVAVPFRNKEKTLILCSRRITFRYRHLMMDIMALLPHSKKDVKVQAKDNKADTLNELADLKNCSSCLLFECRKKKDLYMWLSKTTGGPSAKFLLKAVHTTEELKLTGNHLKGSRPILSFSSEFDKHPHLQLLKELLQQVFCTPKDHRKSKPFFDHVFTFSFLDNHIWFRNYQISVPFQSATNKVDRVALEKMTLVEVGPRFAMNPIKIFSASFGGQTLYENPFYVSPNAERSLEKRKKAGKYQKKVKAKQRRKTWESANQLEPSELADVWDGED